MGILVNKKNWNNKKILVTGQTGFKGAWLCEWLINMGADVSGYALAPNTDPNLYEVLNLENRMASHIGDIRDYENFLGVFENEQPEVVFHMAAQPLVRQSYIDPVETFSTNIMGTVHCLEAIRHTLSVKAGVIITSDKCYDNIGQSDGYKEGDRLGGYDPYSNSKACAEMVSESYRNSFFNPKQMEKHEVALATARAGNVIGGGDWAEDRLIPDIIKAFIEGEEVEIRNPKATRPWQHVLEPLSGYLILAEKLLLEGNEYCEGWNFGPIHLETPQTVENIVTAMVKKLGSEAKWKLDMSPQPHEAKFLGLDSRKANEKLGWAPNWGLDNGLDKTVEWYQEFKSNPNNAIEFTQKQIASYCGW